MKHLSSISNARFLSIAAVIFIGVAVCLSQATSFKAGDRVEVDVNMSSSSGGAKWQKATVVEVMMWQGKISGISVRTDSGQSMTVGERHLRKPSTATPKGQTDPKPPGSPTVKGSNSAHKQTTSQSKFKVGDRVEVDSIMANEAKDAQWVKATVTAVDLDNGRYVVRRDDLNEMSVLVRPGKVWIRPLMDGSSAPAYPTCEFYKNYQRVSDNSAPSAALFKAVIFNWLSSTNRYYDFGVVFEGFKLGAPYKNRARGNGRKDVDPAPVGATIYPLKTRLILCEKDLNSTFRTEWTNEYDCYKNRVGEWVCKNGAPQNYKRSVPIPNDQVN